MHLGEAPVGVGDSLIALLLGHIQFLPKRRIYQGKRG
jgi:hypothetical protein